MYTMLNMATFSCFRFINTNSYTVTYAHTMTSKLNYMGSPCVGTHLWDYETNSIWKIHAEKPCKKAVRKSHVKSHMKKDINDIYQYNAYINQRIHIIKDINNRFNCIHTGNVITRPSTSHLLSTTKLNALN